jgi:hypothetical protein
MNKNNIVWDRCFGVCTDGALCQVIIMVYPHAVWMHCIIHREALASKTISPSFNEVLLSDIDIVNFIKT